MLIVIFAKVEEKKKELTYLSGHERIKEIRDCEIIDLKKNKKIKVKDLFDV